MKENRDSVRFDLDIGRQITEDFSVSTKVSCQLWSANGELLFSCRQENICDELAAAVKMDFGCPALHGRAPEQAMRFGGRYIYSCPMGLVFFASAIMTGGELTGALVAGPVQIMDAEDQLSGSAINFNTRDGAILLAAKKAVAPAPRWDAAGIQALSRQLFASAVYLSDNIHALLAAQNDSVRNSAVDDYIAYLKQAEGLRVTYPLEKEQELFRAIVRGDRESADNLLNQILGYIYFYALDEEEIRIRIEELFVVLIRAAACGGASIDHTLALSRRYLWEIRNIRSQEELTAWLASSLRALTEQVFRSAEVKHSGALEKAIDYMKRRYALKLTLEEVAEYAGYSPTYFSRIFREDTGMTFKEYLNELRIEKSKTLLLTSGMTVTEISSMLGFNDQSYFCKIFKSSTGVTPDKFRKRSRRIDYEKEYGN